VAAQLTCAEAEAVAWRAAVASAALEGVVAGAPVALGVALVGLLESGALAWSAGAVCGALVLWIVFRERVPSRLVSLARADAGLGLRGALEVGVRLTPAARESRHGAAIAAALAGRLGSADVARSGVALKPLLLGAGLAVSLVLAAAIRVESRGAVDVREARLMAGRPTLQSTQARGVEAEAPPAAAAEAEEQAPEAGAEGQRSTPEAADRARAALPGPGENAGGGDETASPGASNLQNSPPGASESSKLAAGAPSGVTLGPEGGKMAASPASRASGAWWPARHDAVVRAWLDSFNSSVRR